ncbi:General stress protein 26 [Micromonospora nigra]|uniref:General stress protein 26 n=1 Tax=Micromonospora nigra TaxID=145857 RepID=A0A1C6RGN8_9ACTN|nr:pyridoxamine 5'-phosphate oxidase family protein [Micromonospora nigra]SCL16256.1 General stress protein 26 [Micromonospora nigra]
MTDESTTDPRGKVTELIRDAGVCMFTTTSLDGRLVSRPMALQEAEFDGELWFFAYADSAKVRQLRVNPEVNLSFSDQKRQSWVSVSGTAREGFDRAKAEQLWSPLLKAWFPDGVDTAGLTLVTVHATSAEYWDYPSGRVVSLLGIARVLVTGKPPGGDNRQVDY